MFLLIETIDKQAVSSLSAGEKELLASEASYNSSLYTIINNEIYINKYKYSVIKALISPHSVTIA